MADGTSAGDTEHRAICEDCGYHSLWYSDRSKAESWKAVHDGEKESRHDTREPCPVGSTATIEKRSVDTGTDRDGGDDGD